MSSQNKRILDYLQKGHWLTALKALELFGCFRLASRVYDLRKLGYEIDDKMVKLNSGKHVKSYWLKKN